MMFTHSKPTSVFRHKKSCSYKTKRPFGKIRWKSQESAKLLPWILFSCPKCPCLKDFSILTFPNTTLSNPEFSLEFWILISNCPPCISTLFIVNSTWVYWRSSHRSVYSKRTYWSLACWILLSVWESFLTARWQTAVWFHASVSLGQSPLLRKESSNGVQAKLFPKLLRLRIRQTVGNSSRHQSSAVFLGGSLRPSSWRAWHPSYTLTILSAASTVVLLLFHFCITQQTWC